MARPSGKPVFAALLRDQVCQVRKRNAQGVGLPYEVMSEGCEIAVGAERLLYMPYLNENAPRISIHSDVRFFGLSGIHTRAI